MSKIVKVFGPPGTGKTTYLLDRVSELISEGISPTRIGYFAFTRKAAHEARERAIERFDFLQRSDFGNFRTLHSLAYARLGLNPDKMLKPKLFAEFVAKYNIDASVAVGDEPSEVTVNNPILNVYNLARLRCVHPKIQYDRSELKIAWHHFEYIYLSYQEFLKEHNVYDYTNLLETFATAKDVYYPHIDAVFIDEAQDLSLLQWEIVRRLVNHSDRSWIAGDDDQAIYGFSGADVKQFLQTEGEEVVLGHSYRVPQTVHDLANRIVNRIKLRVEKIWSANDKLGAVSFQSSFYDVDYTQDGTWLVLSATNYLLNDVNEYLRSIGLLFEHNHVRSIAETTIEAVYAWGVLRKGGDISANECRAIFSLLDAKFVKHGYRKFKGPEDTLYSIVILRDIYGLKIEDTLTEDIPLWYDALTKISQEKITYIKAALRRGQSLRGNPCIKLSTIHGAKGGEADNVVLLSDLSNRFMEEYHREPDTITRMLYVAITRTKNRLFIIQPRDVGRAFRI
jgi:DNA helicase II / ATP-dependent DNA helicase PcrA